jgi:SAM-dependent methyltransferase
VTVFGRYSRYYDLLNKGKDYAAEAAYVSELIRRYAPKAKTLLDLGCGTGIHAVTLASMGYQVVGLDRSEEMLAQARHNRGQFTFVSEGGSADFALGDIRNFAVSRKFDVVVALFHVISYLATNDDLEATFTAIKMHLNPGGILIFDHWYGPAVLTDRPSLRVKTFENSQVKITRIATPTMNVNENTVDVGYDFILFEKTSGDYGEFSESHRMRYFFLPEIEGLLSRHSLRRGAFTEWMSENCPNERSWNTVVVATNDIDDREAAEKTISPSVAG